MNSTTILAELFHQKVCLRVVTKSYFVAILVFLCKNVKISFSFLCVCGFSLIKRIEWMRIAYVQAFKNAILFLDFSTVSKFKTIKTAYNVIDQKNNQPNLTMLLATSVMKCERKGNEMNISFAC